MQNGVKQDQNVRMDKQVQVPILQRISCGATIYSLQTLGEFVLWYREWASPTKFPPTTIKYYQCRPSLPIRYDNTEKLELKCEH